MKNGCFLKLYYCNIKGNFLNVCSSFLNFLKCRISVTERILPLCSELKAV